MFPNPTIPIGERLRAARTARDLSLGEVAVQLGVSAATLSRIETNKQSLDLPLFLEIARVLGVRAAGMLEEDGDGSGAPNAEELIEGLAALTSAERARIFAAANERSRGRRNGGAASIPTRVDGLLQSLNAVKIELLDVRAALKRQR